MTSQMRSALVALLATAAAAEMVAAAPVAVPLRWLTGFAESFPCDIIFVKGKKVAGTTVGGVMRRLGHTYGIDFFSPVVPNKAASAAWRSGGREKFILERFGEFAAEHAAGARRHRPVAWAQEQTLSPRRRGLLDTSLPLAQLSERALRITVVREPVAHALSSCTHFGPCGSARTAGRLGTPKNTSVAAKLEFVTDSMKLNQMWRFITPHPDADVASEQSKAAAAKAAVEFYHAVLLADEIDASLVALALSVPTLRLSDVLYLPAKTTHTARRPAVERQPAEFVDALQTLFYGASSAPDTHVYRAAKARLDATVAQLPDFDARLADFKGMQTNMLLACRSDDGATERGRLPRGLSPRDAGECLYGDQGCGYKCINTWLANPTVDGAAGHKKKSSGRMRRQRSRRASA